MVGLGVVDCLLDEIYDPESSIVYQALSCYNNPDIAARCTIKGAPKVIYAVTATKDFNSTIALGLRESFRQGRIRLLISEDDFDEYSNDISGYAKLSAEDKLALRLPYINTTLLIAELTSLQYETRNGVVAVKERSNMRKDRYSSLAYCIEIAKTIDKEQAADRKKKTFQDYVVQFRNPEFGRAKVQRR